MSAYAVATRMGLRWVGRHLTLDQKRHLRGLWLDATTALLYPRAHPFPARPHGPVVVSGYFSRPTGLGRAARLTAAALEAEGVTVLRHDLSGLWTTGLPPLPDGAATWIIQDNPPTVEHIVMATPRARRPLYVIGYWTWEQPLAPPAWRRSARAMNEIWAPSRYVERALRTTLGNTPPIRLVPHPVPKRTPLRRPPGPPRLLLALDLGSTAERKNPEGALQAMIGARREGAVFLPVVKIASEGPLPPALDALLRELETFGPVERIDETLTDAEMDALLLSCQGVLSLHRSEGFGLVPAEAVAAGIPVIATDYGGTTDFVTPETGYPVPWTPVHAPKMAVGFDPALGDWAEADVRVAVTAILTWTDEDQRRWSGAMKRAPTEC